MGGRFGLSGRLEVFAGDALNQRSHSILHLSGHCALHAILGAMRKVYEVSPSLAREQASELRPLCGGLLSHLDEDPAVKARGKVVKIQSLF